MQQLSVKDQLKKLVELQNLDGEIYALKKAAAEKPLFIEKLKEQFEGTKIRLKALEDKFKAALLDRKDKELNLKVKEEGIAKANVQLSQIKTNKEYTAKINEIEGIKADKSILEEKILISYDDSDKINADIDQEKRSVLEQEKIFTARKKEIEEEVMALEDRIKILEAQREELNPGIDKIYLNRYERILENKGGLAIVPVKRNTCGGCFMNITHQTINAIKMNDQMVECEICSRILYLEDDL